MRLVPGLDHRMSEVPGELILVKCEAAAMGYLTEDGVNDCGADTGTAKVNI